MDYGLPRASDLPGLGFESHPVPARTNPLGAKGCGEAGCAGSLPAVMNALVDALSELGITHIDMPATPLRIWQAIQEACRHVAGGWCSAGFRAIPGRELRCTPGGSR